MFPQLTESRLSRFDSEYTVADAGSRLPLAVVNDSEEAGAGRPVACAFNLKLHSQPERLRLPGAEPDRVGR